MYDNLSQTAKRKWDAIFSDAQACRRSSLIDRFNQLLMEPLFMFLDERQPTIKFISQQVVVQGIDEASPSHIPESIYPLLSGKGSYMKQSRSGKELVKLKSHTERASRYNSTVVEALKVAFPGRASAFGTSFNHLATAFVKKLRFELRLEFIKYQSSSTEETTHVRFDPLSHAARCSDEVSIGQRNSVDLQAAFE